MKNMPCILSYASSIPGQSGERSKFSDYFQMGVENEASVRC